MRSLLAGVLFAALPALAQTGYPAMNPTARMPLAAMANPLGWQPAASFPPFGSPAPLGTGAFMLGGLMRPGLQLVPNLLTYQHLQYLTNPYLGGLAAGNPYLQPLLQSPPTPLGAALALPSIAYGTPGSTLPLPAFYALPAATGGHNPFAAAGLKPLASPLAPPQPVQIVPWPSGR